MKMLQTGCRKVGIVILPLMVVCFLVGGLWSYVGWALLFVFVQCVILFFAVDKVNQEDKQYLDYGGGKRTRLTTLFELAEGENKRYNIVRDFSKKYGLSLSSDKIDLIVDASYISYYWAKEIHDMDKEYTRISDWYKGETVWLRVYMYAFPHLNISSDFDVQYEYVMSYFKKVFDEIPMSKYKTVEEYIREVNRKFLTTLDEISFMTMVRFMKEEGIEIELPSGDKVINESEVEKLMRKYDKKL
ncbi:MAG: hypothetical protein IJO70_00855 [Lachnospiraceae bacterium]|nr:hypothetical protein [Lachnospiraceae bacterium]